MPDSMINAWNILDHKATPRQRTLLDEMYRSCMTILHHAQQGALQLAHAPSSDLTAFDCE
jgi:hypothetical protein